MRHLSKRSVHLAKQGLIQGLLLVQGHQSPRGPQIQIICCVKTKRRRLCGCDAGCIFQTRVRARTCLGPGGLLDPPLQHRTNSVRSHRVNQTFMSMTVTSQTAQEWAFSSGADQTGADSRLRKILKRDKRTRICCANMGGEDINGSQRSTDFCANPNFQRFRSSF